MKALIFSAGLGTRFKPWTDKHPKALAPVNGKPLLQRNIEYLRSYGISDVVVNVHHFADQIIAALKENNGWGSNVEISDEQDAVLETGGGLLKAKPLLESGPFLTINADILTDLDLHAMQAFHKASDALVTLAVTNRVTSRNFLFDADDRLCGWRNNATGEEKIAINTPVRYEKAYSGIAVYEPEVFQYIHQKGKFSIVETFLDIAPHQLLKGYDHSGSRWLDVGKPDSVEKAELLFS
ncbi:MAG: nucleotidyltransferase family protein [Chitinophagaceae bacterium]